MTAAGNFGLWRCCFFVVFMRFSWGAWEVLPGTVTFLMWEYDRGMVKVGKTGGTGWTGEKEGDRLKIKPAGASYYKSEGGRGRRTAPGKVSEESARKSSRGQFQGRFREKRQGGPGEVSGKSFEGNFRDKLRRQLCISEKVIIINDGSRKKRLQGGDYENTYTLR